MVAGRGTLSRAFPAGAADPVAVITTPAAAPPVVVAARTVPGVASAEVGEQAETLAQVDVVLTAVFAVLGVLPVTVLTKIGTIVGIGVLLDTLLVRTVQVPALVHVLDDRFWLPSFIHRSATAPAAAVDVVSPLP